MADTRTEIRAESMELGHTQQECAGSVYAVIFDDPTYGPLVFQTSPYQVEAEQMAQLHRSLWPDSCARVQCW
jgi:hypothetical protein